MRLPSNNDQNLLSSLFSVLAIMMLLHGHLQLNGVNSFSLYQNGNKFQINKLETTSRSSTSMPLPTRLSRKLQRYYVPALAFSSSAARNSNDDNVQDETIGNIPPVAKLPKVYIEYCTGCRWMMRAAWIAQELLTTFQDDLHSVSLIPSRPPSPGGTFIVSMLENEHVNAVVIWNRKLEGRFPETKELKQRIRDIILPDRDLGHSDVTSKKTTSTDSIAAASTTTILASSANNSKDDQNCTECEDNSNKNYNKVEESENIEFIDDDEAEEMRRFFGVM